MRKTIINVYYELWDVESIKNIFINNTENLNEIELKPGKKYLKISDIKLENINLGYAIEELNKTQEQKNIYLRSDKSIEDLQQWIDVIYNSGPTSNYYSHLNILDKLCILIYRLTKGHYLFNGNKRFAFSILISNIDILLFNLNHSIWKLNDININKVYFNIDQWEKLATSNSDDEIKGLEIAKKNSIRYYN